MKGFKILKILVYAEIILVTISIFKEEPVKVVKHDKVYLIKTCGHFWWANEDGRVFRMASPFDSSKIAVVSCIRMNELSISEKDLNVLRGLKKVLKNPDLSEVCLERKYAIFRKGVVVYFHKWEDFSENFSGIVRYLPYLIPRSRLELFSGGDLLVLKGGWQWQDTRYTHR